MAIFSVSVHILDSQQIANHLDSSRSLSPNPSTYLHSSFELYISLIALKLEVQLQSQKSETSCQVPLEDFQCNWQLIQLFSHF